MANTVRHLHARLDVEKTVFLLCDLQERFRPVICHFPEIVRSAKKMVESSKILNIPLLVTEQYPKGLGSTVSELDISHATCVVPKTKFSMFVPGITTHLQSLCSGNVETIVLFGIEAHVCVEQTAIDLEEHGYKVHIVADATSSRSQEDRLLAFQRFRQMGCTVTTSENVLFKFIGDKEHDKFKEIQALVKEISPGTGLVNSI